LCGALSGHAFFSDKATKAPMSRSRNIRRPEVYVCMYVCASAQGFRAIFLGAINYGQLI
jgi:hypothetical protein